jgi:hypothetical protein
MALFADQAGITVSRMRAHEARANVDWKGLKPSEAVEQIMTETQAFLDQNKFSAQAATSVKETREIK